MWRLAGTALKIQTQIATRQKKTLFLAWFKNWHLSWSLNPTIKCLLTTTTYCCLEAQLTMTKQLQVSLLGFRITQPQDIKHTDSWANGRLITTTLYLISRSDQFYDHISWHCCQLVGLLLLSIATYFCQLHDFTFLLLYFISMYTAYVPL